MAGEVTETNQDNQLENVQAPMAAQNFFQDIVADPQKRLYAILAGVLVVGLLITAFVFSGNKDNQNRGKLVSLVQELDQSRAFEIVAKLKSVNIEAKVTSGEKPGEYVVSVYEKAIDSSYLALSRTNLLEDEGYGLFDESDWAASDYDKRIKLIRAINGDLSRIISRLDGLRAAIVRVNIPEQQLFTEFQATTTASVQVELENDADELSKQQVRSIVNILRGYVHNLEKDKISIVDTQGRNYNTFKTDDDESSEDYIEEVEKINKIIQKRIEKYLDVVLGGDKYKVSVSASVSREKVLKQETKYSKGAVGSRQTGTELLKAGSANSGYGPGSGGAGKDYQHKSNSETMLPSFEQQSVTFLPGRVTDVTVALAIDNSVPAMISIKQLQESVAAIVGPQIEASQIKMTVVDLMTEDDSAALIAAQQKPGFWAKLLAGSTWSFIGKVFSILGMILGLLIVGIIALNFLSSAANVDTEVDSELGDEFDQVLNEAGFDDYGEAEAQAQQEELLREMMQTQTATMEPAAKEVPAGAGEQVEFDSLLQDFQEVADNKPDVLAKKIQVWLDEE